MKNQNVKTALMSSIEKIKNNPNAANLFMKADTKLIRGVQCSAQVRHFPPIIVDEHTSLGGSDTGVNPVELLLVSLGTCQEIMYSTYASVLGIELDSVKVTLKGDINLKGMLGLDEKVPSGFNNINFETHIESDADEETLMNLIDAVEEHCPVMDTILREITISGSAAVNGKELFRSVAKNARVCD